VANLLLPYGVLQGVVADSRKESVESYVKAALHKSDRERSETAKDKTGVFTGGQHRQWDSGWGGEWDRE
jgi:hypothetical protein